MVSQYSPNPQQQAAINWRGGHALVLAGAGTGKTFTIIERTKSLISDGIKPKRIALLTFTRRAANEMKARIGANHEGIFAGTFHAWSIMLMHSNKDFPVRPSEWTIIDRDDQLQLIRRIKSQLIDKGQSRRYPTPGEVLSYISYARSTVKPLTEYLQSFSSLEGEQSSFVVEAGHIYRQHKLSRRYLDYDDILEVIASSLEHNETLARNISSAYDEVLIDEGQDLNPLQWAIIDSMVPHTRIFMVGDDGQSIYAFRGADFESIHSFTKRIPGSNVLKLEENYRSKQEILDLANWVLDQSKLQYQKRLFSTRGQGGVPVLHHFRSDYDEADWITNTILECHNSGDLFQSNMILVRTMSAAKQIEASLISKKIPYVLIGGQSLFALAHTKDLLSVIRATVNPLDELAWMRYLTLFQGIGEITADRIVDDLLKTKTIGEAKKVIEIALEARSAEVLAPVIAIGRYRNEPARALDSALSLLQHVFEHRYSDDWSKRAPDMRLMISLAERRSDVIDFIETYTLDPIHGTGVTGTGPEDKVTLITIHSAKGLEGKRVFIPQAQYGMYPFVRSMGSEAEIEEERRILYVAITRAQDELILSNGVSGYRGFQTNGSDFFLEDAPSELLSHQGESEPMTRSETDLDSLSEWG